MSNTPAIRTLCIGLPERRPPHFSAAGFEFEWVADVVAVAGVLRERDFGCVVLFLTAGGAPSGAAIEQLRDDCDAACLPLVLAASIADPDAIIERFADAAFDGFVEPCWPPGLRGAALRAAIGRFQVGRNVVAIQQQVLGSAADEFRSLRELVFADDLTTLHNLRYFREMLAREHARSERHARGYALVYFDVDGLKTVNTRYGHAAGGLVLAQVGRLIAETTRASDLSFRVGGDEFTSLLVENNKDGGQNFAERTLAAVRGCDIAFEGTLLRVTLSAGVAAYPEDGDTKLEVLAHADAAVFAAKEGGKDRVVCFGR